MHTDLPATGTPAFTTTNHACAPLIAVACRLDDLSSMSNSIAEMDLAATSRNAILED